jgi:raffinose/stachyose/melibiose transport system substrate-binding protein
MIKQYLRLSSVMFVLLALLAACVAPAAAPTTGEAAGSEEQGVTLQVWDIWNRPQDSELIETLHRQFEEAHPGVTIDRVVKSFDDMKATAKLGLSSPDGPDVAFINQGWSDMGALVKADLLVDLTPYAEQYGWSEKLSPGIVARNSFTADGNEFGTGNLYGVPVTAELVGVFYRKDIFAEHGLEVPKTFAEFESILEMLKAAGEVPLNLGNLGGLESTQEYGELLNVNLDERAYLDDLIFVRGNVGWDTPENVQAATKLQEWVTAGYFTDGFAGISDEDSIALFSSGEGAMKLTGSWISSEIIAGPNADNIGFFLLPPATEGAYKLSIGGTSLDYAIRKGTPHETLAAEYIDWMFSDTASAMWAEIGVVPLGPVDPSVLTPDTLFADLVTAWNQMNQTDSVGHYLDWATPTFYDTMTGALEELMAFQITPEEFVQKLQTDYSTFLAEREAAGGS